MPIHTKKAAVRNREVSGTAVPNSRYAYIDYIDWVVSS